MKITRDQVAYLNKNYKKYSDTKLAKALNESKNWVYLALNVLELKRGDKDRAHIHRNAKQAAPDFVEKTNIPYVVSGESLLTQHKYSLVGILIAIAIAYIAFIPNNPAGTYGAELAVCATDKGLPSGGFPLYIFIANLFCSLNLFGSVAWQLQLFSALCTVATCGILCTIFYRFSSSFFWSVLITALFAFFTSTWENAITTSPIPLAMMFFSVTLYQCISWYESPHERKIIFIIVSLIAAITSHPFFVVFIPAVLLFLFLAHRDYKLSKETIFSAIILLFLGLNIFLAIPFISWNHNVQQSPQGFYDILQTIVNPELHFTSFSISKFTTSFGLMATTSSVVIGLIILITISTLSFYAIRQIHESKPALAKLFLFILITYLSVFTVFASLNTSHDFSIALRYLSLPLFVVLAIFVTQIFAEKKLAYAICVTVLIAQIFVNPISSIQNDFIDKYSKYVLESTPEKSVIIADNNIYWSLVFNNNSQKHNVLLAQDKKHKQLLMRENSNAYLTYADPTVTYTRFSRNGLLWHRQKKLTDIPQWTTTKKLLSAVQQDLVSQYHLTNAIGFMEKNNVSETIEQISKATKHQVTGTKLLIRYAQRTAAKKKYDDVIRIYEHLHTISPTKANYFLAIARVKNIQGKTIEAEKYYKNALKIEPRNFFANIELAKIYEKTNRMLKAQKIYESMIEFYPNSAYSYKKLAQIYRQNKATQDKAKEMDSKSAELGKKTQQAPEQKQTPGMKYMPMMNMSPQLPNVPKPQDFFPKISNSVPGNEK